jgi:hypothetical protein
VVSWSCSGSTARALTAAFIDQALKASEGIAGLSAAIRGLMAARTAVMTAVAAIRCGHEAYDKGLPALPPANDHPRRRSINRTRLCGCNRRSFAIHRSRDLVAIKTFIAFAVAHRIDRVAFTLRLQAHGYGVLAPGETTSVAADDIRPQVAAHLPGPY